MTEAMPTVLPETSPRRGILRLLSDRESAGGTDRITMSKDDGKRTRGTYHITLEAAQEHAQEFPFLNRYKGLSDQNRDSFAQYMIENPETETKLARAVLDKKYAELEAAGVSLSQLREFERDALGLLFFNAGTGGFARLKRNLSALTKYRAKFGETPTPEQADILERLRIASAGEMDAINAQVIVEQEDGTKISERKPVRGLAIRQLSTQDYFLTGEDTFKSYYQGGNRAESVRTTNKAKQLIDASNQRGQAAFEGALPYIKMDAAREDSQGILSVTVNEKDELSDDAQYRLVNTELDGIPELSPPPDAMLFAGPQTETPQP